MSIFMVIFIAAVMYSHANSSNDANFEMDEKEYTFSFSFRSSLPKDSILRILYDYNHLRLYSSQASDAKVLEVSYNYHDIELHLKYLIYGSKSVYRRTIYPESASVKIEMLRFVQNSNLFPRITMSYAEYLLFSEEDVTVIKYFQKVKFDKQTNWLFTKILKDRLYEFMDELAGYFKKLEA